MLTTDSGKLDAPDGSANGNHHLHPPGFDDNNENHHRLADRISGEFNLSETTSSSRQTHEFSEIALSDQQKQQDNQQEDDEQPKQQGINTISSSDKTATTPASNAPAPTSTKHLPEYPSSQNPDMLLKAANVSITEKLEKALSSVSPFLKGSLLSFNLI